MCFCDAIVDVKFVKTRFLIRNSLPKASKLIFFAYIYHMNIRPHRSSLSKWSRFFSVLRSWLRQLMLLPLLGLVKFYQMAISPYKMASCRFSPTCSQYALEALQKHGPVMGLFLALQRIIRCHPWGGSGYDPVP